MNTESTDNGCDGIESITFFIVSSIVLISVFIGGNKLIPLSLQVQAARWQCLGF
ncbi:MAG: hypothetical protein KBA66_24640 [Leptospiraceae bacterium]|nr:hypothetical protein [Leptospiraceae bacterium]